MTLKSLDHANIDNENFLYPVFNNLGEYIKEKNEIKYLVFTFTDKNKEALEIHKTLEWN